MTQYVIQDKAGAYWCTPERWSVFRHLAARWGTLLGASQALSDLAPLTIATRLPLSIVKLREA